MDAGGMSMSNISATVGLVNLFWIVISILAAYGAACFAVGYVVGKRRLLPW